MPDMQTGEISATVDWGFWIERGEFVFPVKNTMVAGNAIELMCKIDAISSDCRREPGAVMPDLYQPPPVVRNGLLEMPAGPGWGVTVNPDWLAKAEHQVSQSQ